MRDQKGNKSSLNYNPRKKLGNNCSTTPQNLTGINRDEKKKSGGIDHMLPWADFTM